MKEFSVAIAKKKLLKIFPISREKGESFVSELNRKLRYIQTNM